MKRPYMEPELAREVKLRVDEEMQIIRGAKRDRVTLFVLEKLGKCGNAERFIRRNGQVGWRATQSLLDEINEIGLECEDLDE